MVSSVPKAAAMQRRFSRIGQRFVDVRALLNEKLAERSYGGRVAAAPNQDGVGYASETASALAREACLLALEGARNLPDESQRSTRISFTGVLRSRH